MSNYPLIAAAEQLVEALEMTFEAQERKEIIKIHRAIAKFLQQRGVFIAAPTTRKEG